MDVFQALADPRRRDIIGIIATHGELSSGDISDNFDITPPAISQHLKILREANLVRVEKRAQKRIYRINPKTMGELDSWVKHMTRTWNERLDRLGNLLKQHKGGKHGKTKR